MALETITFAVWNYDIQQAKRITEPGKPVSALELAMRRQPGAGESVVHVGWICDFWLLPSFGGQVMLGKRLAKWLVAEKKGEDIGPIIVHIADSKAEIVDYEPDPDGIRSNIYGIAEPSEFEKQKGRTFIANELLSRLLTNEHMTTMDGRRQWKWGELLSALLNSEHLQSGIAEPNTELNPFDIDNWNRYYGYEHEYDEVLLEELRTERNCIAKEEDLHVFFVLQDSELMEISAKAPQSEEELLAIRGIGPIKLKKYGRRILEIIWRHLGG